MVVRDPSGKPLIVFKSPMEGNREFFCPDDMRCHGFLKQTLTVDKITRLSIFFFFFSWVRSIKQLSYNTSLVIFLRVYQRFSKYFWKSNLPKIWTVLRNFWRKSRSLSRYTWKNYKSQYSGCTVFSQKSRYSVMCLCVKKN